MGHAHPRARASTCARLAVLSVALWGAASQSSAQLTGPPPAARIGDGRAHEAWQGHTGDQKRLEEIERPPDRPERQAQKDGSALERAIEQLPEAPPPTRQPIWSQPAGPATLRLVDLSLDLVVAAGGSSAGDEEIQLLQAGAHDPHRRGFTLQQVEMSLTGAVDPYLRGEAHAIFDTEGVELEAAFFTTQALPHGLQLEAGNFFTEFGLINPVHPHAWDWLDQPVILSRLFGGEGLRAPGARLGWLVPLPWFAELHLGAQNPNEEETTVSFLGPQGIGGRTAVRRDLARATDLLYLVRWNQSWDLTSDLTALLGFSGLHGPNSTAPDADTWIYGADLKLRWRPASNFRGWPFLLWQSELAKRDAEAPRLVSPKAAGPVTELVAENEQAPEGHTILRDWGLYAQLLYGFRYGWAAGLRYEYASGRGDSLGGRNADPLRDDRHRVSPLLVWHPTEYSRFRLQYNYDNAAHRDARDAHSVWLGAEVLYGAHPAHQY